MKKIIIQIIPGEKMNETTIHTIEIDDNITVQINIPIKLNILEFQGLMEKTKKLFTISSINLSTVKKSPVKNYIQYTPEMEKEILKLHKQKISVKKMIKILNKKFNIVFNEKSLYSKIGRLSV